LKRLQLVRLVSIGYVASNIALEVPGRDEDIIIDSYPDSTLHFASDPT